MKFNELIKQRFSSRKYKSTPVEEEKIKMVLEAARLAPSAANYQPWRFYVVRNTDLLKDLQLTYSRDWFKTANTVIVALGDKDISWKRNFDNKDHIDIDLAIAIDHITLQATEIGLSTCWVCNFNPSLLCEVLNLPEHLEPIALIPIGYPDDHADLERHKTKRNPLDSIVTWM